MSNNQKSSLEKIILAGIGAVASTVDRAKEIVDELVEKGELTVEQGKVMNEELKHEVKDKIATEVIKPVSEKAGLFVIDNLDNLSEDELADLKQKITVLETERKEQKEESDTK